MDSSEDVELGTPSAMEQLVAEVGGALFYYAHGLSTVTFDELSVTACSARSLNFKLRSRLDFLL